MLTAAATSIRLLEVVVRIFTSLYARIEASCAISTNAFVLDNRTPIVPAAVTFPPVGAAEADARTLISRSSLMLSTVTLPEVLVSAAPLPIFVHASALSITTATVPPTATFEFPAEADSETKTASISMLLATLISSLALMAVLLPTMVFTVLSAAITFIAPPTVRLLADAPSATDAATVTSRISALTIAVCT